MEGHYQDNERSLLKKTQHMELPDRNKALICIDDHCGIDIGGL